jgi:hypothetical protein
LKLAIKLKPQPTTVVNYAVGMGCRQESDLSRSIALNARKLASKFTIGIEILAIIIGLIWDAFVRPVILLAINNDGAILHQDN